MNKVVWVVAIVINAFAQLLSPGYLIADTLFMFIGRLLGVYVITYLILLPLKLVKKDAFRKKMIPYLFLIISLISLLG